MFFSLGFHLNCRQSNLNEIPLEFLRYLQQTDHQQLIVDFSSNRLSTIDCDLFRISTIKTLILTDNHFQSIPTCFSQSSIEYLILKRNYLRFNSSTILSSRKLIHLDLSENFLPSLPSNFLHYLRRLRTLVMTSEEHLFHWSTSEWLRSISSRNQLSVVLCTEHVPLSLCLFNHLFEEKKLFMIELHPQVFCDCTWIYLPLDRINFRRCFHSDDTPIAQCHRHSSRFEHGYSIDQLQKESYREICGKEYRICKEEKEKEKSLQLFNATIRSIRSQVPLTTTVFFKTLINQSATNTTSIIPNNSNVKKITAGAIILSLLVFVLVTVVCLSIILSGQYFRIKTQQKYTDEIFQKKISFPVLDNLNTNSNPYPQEDDVAADLTFYSLPADSSVTHLPSSCTELQCLSSMDSSSSFSSETLVISDGNKSNIYS